MFSYRISLLAITCGLALQAADPHLSSGERAEAMKDLTESRGEFLASIEGLTPRQWSWKPAPNRWSIGETSEHVVLAEALFFGYLKQALAAPPQPKWAEETEGKTELIKAVLAPRIGKAQAPSGAVPSGKLTHAEVIEKFEAQRREIEAFARETRLPIKEHLFVDFIPAIGTLNGFQWLIYVPLHTERHDKQIAEIKDAPGYPR